MEAVWNQLRRKPYLSGLLIIVGCLVAASVWLNSLDSEAILLINICARSDSQHVPEGGGNPQVSSIGALSASSVAGVSEAPLPSCAGNWTLWFIAMDDVSAHKYAGYAQVAVMSAKKYAPCLMPNLIYPGPPNRLTRWFQKQGGVVHFHRLSFEWQLKVLAVKDGWQEDGWADRYGPYMRIDVPAIIESAQYNGLFPDTWSDVSHEYVLYTDCDVMFITDVDVSKLSKPAVFSIGPEGQRGTKANTGVMYINVTGFRNDVPALIKYGVDTGWKHNAWDQGLVLDFYNQDRMTQLPDEYNWKGYWGHPEGNGEQSVLLHWHGPKPMSCLDCYVDAMSSPGWGGDTDRLYELCSECPKVYTDIFRSSPDNGAFYKSSLITFIEYYLAANNGSEVRYDKEQFFADL